MARLTPVDFDPFAQQPAGPKLTPVDFDPFTERPPRRASVANPFGIDLSEPELLPPDVTDVGTELRAAWPGLKQTLQNAMRDPVATVAGPLGAALDLPGTVAALRRGEDPIGDTSRAVADSIQATADASGAERQAIRAGLSPKAQALDQEIAQTYQDEGFLSGFMKQLRNPSSIARLVAGSAPATGAAVLAGRFGARGVMGATVPMGAGEAISGLRDEILQANPFDLLESPIYREALERTGDDRAAREALFESVRDTAGMVGAGAGTIPGLPGLNPVEQALSRQASSTAARGALGRFMGSRTGRAAREAIGEVPEEVGINLGSNLAQAEGGLDVDPFDGTAQAAGGAILAGGTMGALTPGQQPAQPVRDGADLLGGGDTRGALAEAMRRQAERGRPGPAVPAAAPAGGPAGSTAPTPGGYADLDAAFEEDAGQGAPVPPPGADPALDDLLTRNVPPPAEGQGNAPAAALPSGLPEETVAGQPPLAPVDAAAAAAATSPANALPEPTDAQKEAGNYQKGHRWINGLNISIENPAGSTRSGTSPDGRQWSNTMQAHYGYIRGTTGADGDHIDAFIRPGFEGDPAAPVFVIDQVDPETGQFDESKVMLGYASEAEAREAYRGSYEEGWQGLGGIAQMTLPEFKEWSKRPRLSRRPLSPEVRELQAERALDDSVDQALDQVLSGEQMPLFSRPPDRMGEPEPRRERPVRGDNPVSAGWTLLAGNDAVFQVPVSDKQDLEGIFKETVSGDWTIDEAPELIDQTDWDDGGPADRTWRLTTPQDSKATVYERNGAVWIDVSDLKKGGDGKRIYSAVANYAHNTGKVFIGDPAGLSDTAVYRRLENMLASALKFGTTRHLWPHARQVEGQPQLGVPGLNWKDGDDAHNIRELLTASYQAIRAQAPEIADMTYNPDARRFERADGTEVSNADFEELAERVRQRQDNEALEREARRLAGAGVRDVRAVLAERSAEGTVGGASGVGRTTLKRAVLTHALLSGEGEARSRLLAELGRQRGARDLSEPFRGLLYSVAAAERPTIWNAGSGTTQGVSVARVRDMVDRIATKWTGDAPRVEVLATAEGLPAWVKSDPDYRLAEGFYDQRTGTVYLVAPNLTSLAHARRVLAHEVVGHHGIEAIAGPETWSWVKGHVERMRRDGRHAALFADIDSRYAPDDPAYLREVVAVMAERGVGVTLLDRLAAAVRRFLASLGLTAPASEDAVRQLIVRAARQVRTGPATEGAGDLSPAGAWSRGREDDPQFARPAARASTEPAAAKGPPASTAAETAPPSEPGPEATPDFFPKLPGLLDRKGIEGVRRTFEGAAELLMRTKGLEPLGRAIRSFYDREQQLQGEVAKILDAPMRAAFGMRSQLKGFLAEPMRAVRTLSGDPKIEREFERWAATWDRGAKPGQPTAAELYERASPEAKGLIEAWIKAAKMTGDHLQEAGVEVFDAKLGSWRPIGRARRFFPRVLHPRFEEAMRDPVRHPEAWAELTQELLKAGVITTAEEAGTYLVTQRARPSQVQGDYFAGVEMARTEGLPESLYDHRFSRAVEYLSRWSSRLAQIEAFGQSHKDGGDVFDRAQRGIVDSRTREYLNTLQEVIYGSGAKSLSKRAMATLNQIATGLMLGNPATATLNLIGGMTLTNIEMGRDAFRAYLDLRNAAEAVKDAREMGVLNEDYLRLLHDSEGLTPEWLSRAVSGAMKVGGYTHTERLIRLHAFLAARNKLRRALRAWGADMTSREARREAVWAVRNGHDPFALLAEASSEGGTGPETERFIRSTVNLVQGSYKLDQVPLWADTPVGRFLFKYWKFSNQLSRMFVRNFFEPLVKAMTLKGEQVEITDPRSGELVTIQNPRTSALVAMLRYFGLAVTGGLTVNAIRALLFGYQAGGPDDDELERALKDGEVGKAVVLGVGIAWEGMLATGGIGILQNPYQWTRDYLDRRRTYDPTDPPGLAILKETAALVGRAWDQGTLTARDIVDYANRVSSLSRTVQRAAAYAMASAGSQLDIARLEVVRREVAYARKMARRYAAETGITGVRRAPGAFGATANTVTNRAIVDALYLGEPERAKAILRAHLDGLSETGSIESAALSAKASVRLRQPLLVSDAPSNAERRAFLAWARENLTEDGVRRLELIDQTYRSAAISAGLLKRPNHRQERREDRRRRRDGEEVTEARRRRMYREMGLPTR